MNNFLRFVVLLGLVTSAPAQIDTESNPPELDQNDLFTRAAASRLVIIGNIVKMEARSERVAPEKLRERLNQGTVRGGSLITVQVEEIVCRQSDFDKNVPRFDDQPQLLSLFIPFGELDLPDGHYREKISPNRRYLLLLAEIESESLTKKYELDRHGTYYRGEGHNRGVIPLDPETPARRARTEPEVVDKFRKLCPAMRPAKSAEKLALLQQLADSNDPVLQKEAENAQKAVRASMRSEQQLDATPR